MISGHGGQSLPTLAVLPGCVLRSNERIWVYRNLREQRTSGTVTYSVMQCGRVVARATDLWLNSAEFRVRQGGRRRVLETGRKNVHAFVVGFLCDPDNRLRRHTHRVRYDPRAYAYFTARVLGEDVSVHSAGLVHCGPAGLEAEGFGRTGSVVKSTRSL